jgi:cupin 2 domain-containing protein
MPPTNLLSNLPPTPPPNELFTPLLAGHRFRVERILSFGHASPPDFWYDQPEDEWVLLLTGAARLQFEDQPPFDLIPGSHVHIPAHRRHRVDWTTPDAPTVWLAIHYSPSQVENFTPSPKGAR